MNRIQIMSDLHFEFEEIPIPDVDAILVLAGDIGKKFGAFKVAKEKYPHRDIIYVAGNHEYYGASIPNWTDKFRAFTANSNVHFLEQESFVTNGVRFLGCTLWTDYLLLGEDKEKQLMLCAQQEMNDFKKIRKSPHYRRLRPFDVASIHSASVRWLETCLKEKFDGKTVVVTHHAPSVRSLAAEDRGGEVSASFSSDLDGLMNKYSIDYWIHGHTHRCVDYNIGQTRVISNQRGYPDELEKNFRLDFVVDI